MNPNNQARLRAQKRNRRNPRDTRREKEWRQKYNVALLDRGVPLDYVLGLDPPIELDSDPVECAEEEIWCMTQDSEPITAQA